MPGKVVFIGCGKIATQTALTLQSAHIDVLAVRRNTESLPSTLPSVSADTSNPSSLEFLQTIQPHTIVYSVTADSFNAQAYTNAYLTGLQNVIQATDKAHLKRLIFVSSTAVYHQNDGSLVDETSSTEPTRFNGQIMLEAEKFALSTEVGVCLRYSGIYGPGRTRMIDRVRNGQCTNDASTTFTNRIHSDDCSAVLSHVIKLDSAPQLLVASDSTPTTAPELETFIANQLGIPKRYPQTNNNTPKRIAGSKRCSNQLLLDTGYQMIYPDYKAGYKQLIQDFIDER